MISSTKRLITFTFLLLALSVQFSFGQTSRHPNGIVLKWLLTDYNWPINFDNFQVNELSHGGIIGYNRLLNKSLNLEIASRFGTVNWPTSDSTFIRKQSFIGGDAILSYQFNNDYLFNENAVVYPYLFGGIGFNYRQPRLEKTFEVVIPFGVGINVRMFERGYLQAQAEYRHSTKSQYHSTAYSVGFVFMLKEHPLAKNRPENEKQGKVRDSDNDGVNDMLDKCPDVAGPTLSSGCPDADGDGIADLEDECPNEAGPTSTNGCPDQVQDSDADGIPDEEDQCPEQKGPGETFGCPDSDGDGLIDKLDECPDIKGILATKGCPPMDKDKDGVVDDNDQCPEVPGLSALAGCPDSDGDGVADQDDTCPELPGRKITGGCPDTDNDRVADQDDLCPEMAGPVGNKGCPLLQRSELEFLKKAAGQIQFYPGSDRLRTASKEILVQVAELAKKYPFYHFELIGHTDNVGSSSTNLRLSEKRANACKTFLEQKGIPPGRLKAFGKGEEEPMTSNKTKEGRASNRRVAIRHFLPE